MAHTIFLRKPIRPFCSRALFFPCSKTHQARGIGELQKQRHEKEVTQDRLAPVFGATHAIVRHEQYGTEVSPDFIISVTDEVMADALSWQSRPLETMYPVVFFDALRAISATTAWSATRPSPALGIQANGQLDVLGLWIERTEGAKFRLKVFNESTPARTF